MKKFYGLLAQRFCQINKTYVEPFQQIFKDTYATTHRLDANRLRNVSKFFSHLLFTDAISWEVLEIMKLNEEDTNSSSRIFIKILFQELAEYMGLEKFNNRLKDPTMQEHFAGLFPRDSPKNTRFSINFFTSIGLGGLTDELREHLKNIPKNFELVVPGTKKSSESSSDSSSEEDSSSSESSSSEDDNKKKLKQKKGKENVKRKKKKKDTTSEEESSDPEELDKNQKKKDKTEKEENYKNRKYDGKQGNMGKKDTDKGRDGRAKKDYEWIKSRHEDNIQQLKDTKKLYERPSRRRSRSRERAGVKHERDRYNKGKH
ncbi:hypothetical protein NQ317_004161 [Molorchus minor]|uniref:MI domain-containing protein n=1 Tax=Molorchus minor TaxID=1323400 RepID=A0ABQ9JUD9_9CUCU|nr:hypothetical protein NQ317_004161 [Molorchus minor]